MVLNKLSNYYAEAIDETVYRGCPKAVFAAIAISALTTGGDFLADAEPRLIREWWVLYRNGIVPQKPPFADPGDSDA